MNILQLLTHAHPLPPIPVPGGGPGSPYSAAMPPPPMAPPPDPLAPLPDAPPQPAAAPPPQQPPAAPSPQAPAAPAAPATPAAPANAAPTHRRSVIDTIGRIADALATVGGATPLYQPSIDADLARTNAAQDRITSQNTDRQKAALGEQELTSGQQALEDHQTARLGAVARGLDAIQQAGRDPAKAFGALAAKMNIPPDQIAAVQKQLDADPTGTIEGMNTAFNPADKGGGVPKEVRIYNMLKQRDPTGKLAASYLGGLADPKAITDYQQATLNLRGKELGLKTRTQGYKETSTNNNLGERQYEFDNKPVKGAKGAKAGGTGDMAGPLASLANIEEGFTALHGMNALPGEGGVVGNIIGSIGRTGIGNAIGQQAGTQASQMRLQIAKNVSALQQAMLKSLPASATRTKFEQEMLARGLPDPNKMDYSTAHTVIGQLRSSFVQAQRDALAEVGTGGGRQSSPRPTLSARPSGGLPPRIGARSAPAAPVHSGHTLVYNPRTGKIQ